MTEKPPTAQAKPEEVARDEEPAFFEVDLPPVPIEEKLDLYEIYREMGGEAHEPNESQLRAMQEARRAA